MRLRRAFERSLNTRRERLIRLETRLAGQHPGRQLALLRQFGCDQVQGYLISKPLPLSELARFLVFGRYQALLAGLSP